MGNSESKPKSQKKDNKKLYNLLKVHSDFNNDTINFSRKDLLNTLSDSSFNELIQAGGGDRLKNVPKRDRYSKYETQQIKSHNQNLLGGNQFSSVSAEEMNGLRNLVLHGAGCGCGENNVLKLEGGSRRNMTESSSYNPINSITMTESYNMHGAGCGSATSSYMPSQVAGDLSATSIDNSRRRPVDGSATSSYMPSQAMGDLSATSTNSVRRHQVNNSATSSYMPSQAMGDLSATSTNSVRRRPVNSSATSSYMPSQAMGDLSATSTNSVRRRPVNNSATSSYMPSQAMGDLSATSIDKSRTHLSLRKKLHSVNRTKKHHVDGSATSSYMPSQVVGDVSPTSTDGTKLPKKKNRLVKLLVSPSSKQNGGGLSSGSSLSNASSSISTISRSATGTKYHDLIGGFQNGGQKDDDAKSDFDESPSTTTTESTTTENTKNTENSDSTIKDKQSRLERLSTASKTQSSKTRSAKSSSTSSSGTTYSSSSSSTSFESSSSNHSSDTSTSSKSSSSAESKLSKNIYLSTSMSGGNVIDAKQFYSSDNGEIYSSDTNYLRHNLTKRRFR